MEKRPKFTQICIFYWDGCILVQKDFDQEENRSVFKCIGGGLKYGESFEEGLRREIMAELGQGIEDIHPLGLANGVFQWDKTLKHRVYLVYDARFLNRDFYQKEAFLANTSEGEATLQWKPLTDFQNGDLLYPKGLLEFLEQKQCNNQTSWIIES